MQSKLNRPPNTSSSLVLLLSGLSIGVIGTAIVLSSVAENNARDRVKVAHAGESPRETQPAQIANRTTVHRAKKKRPGFVKGSLLARNPESTVGEESPAAVPEKVTEQKETAKAVENEKKSEEPKNYSWLKPEQAATEASAANPGVVTTVRHYVVTYHPGVTREYIVPGPQQAITTTASGYSIPSGDGLRAVDHPDSGVGPWTIGRNGLRQNPCVDPPSTMGRAYNLNGAY